MTIEQARAIVDGLRRPPNGFLDQDGYLDVLARIEKERALTDLEKQAGDVICANFARDLRELAEAMGRASAQMTGK